MQKIENMLKKWFDLESVDISRLFGSYFSLELDNINEYTEGKYSIEEIENSLSVYGIKYNEKSEKYFSESWGHCFPLKTLDGDLVLLVITFEKDNYEYFTSNSTRLQLDLIVELGVTEEDITEQNDKYYSYKGAKDILDNYDKFI
ncbi:hypothetical protein [Desemzia sp. FAM 23991]|uniref:hypothetical protein n=1 Tax=unclassified Desemzia TaxID=2685243 RepID=UPI003889074E